MGDYDDERQGLSPCYEPYPNADGTVSYTAEDAEKAKERQEERSLLTKVFDFFTGY